MSGITLCNSVSLRSCVSHSLRCSQKSRFFTSLFTGTSACISLVPRSRNTLLKVQALLHKRNDGFRSFAVKKRRNSREDGLIESDGLDEEGEDEDYDDEDWDEYDVGDHEDDDDDGVVLPLEKMNKWLEKKPHGFGEGKAYDTSIEDKLLNEIEQSRKAQSANLNKLKNEPVKANSKIGSKNIKGDEDAEIGIRVRVWNLPKKKNVHKDLKSAFKGVSGVLDIIPAVSGNNKTRDPVCKGFAFVDFKTGADANRFVDLFSGQRLSFGKVQKIISCQVLSSSSSRKRSEQDCLDEGSEDEQEVPDSGFESLSNDDFVVEEAFLDPRAESYEFGYSDKELGETETEDVLQNLVSSSIGTPKALKHDPKIHSKSPKQVDKIQAKKRDTQEVDNIGESIVSFREAKFEETVAEAEQDDQLDMEDIEEDLESARAEKLKDVGSETARQLKSSSTSSQVERLVKIRKLEHKLLAKGKLWEGAETDEPGQKPNKVGKKMKNDKKKKILAKGQGKKVTKLEIPGSSKRLKVKEKAVLTGVLSKYAAKACTTSHDE